MFILKVRKSQSIPDWIGTECCSPALGLEKHPPMVGPGMRDARGEGGKEGEGAGAWSEPGAQVLGGEGTVRQN